MEADFYSKLFDWHDWRVADSIFEYFQNRWGPYGVDRFADNVNTKAVTFNSQFWCPGTASARAFAFDWSGGSNWLVPPVYLVPKVIKHIFMCGGKGTFVIPKWEP